jgi:hypothetical protein
VRLSLDGLDPVGQRVATDDSVANVGNRVSAGGSASGVASAARVEWHVVGVFRDVSNVEQSSLAAAVHAVDPAMPLVSVQTMEQSVSQRLAPDRFNILLYGLVLGLMGAYALGRTMQSMLFGTGALNAPVVLALRQL